MSQYMTKVKEQQRKAKAQAKRQRKLERRAAKKAAEKLFKGLEKNLGGRPKTGSNGGTSKAEGGREAGRRFP